MKLVVLPVSLFFYSGSCSFHRHKKLFSCSFQTCSKKYFQFQSEKATAFELDVLFWTTFDDLERESFSKQHLEHFESTLPCFVSHTGTWLHASMCVIFVDVGTLFVLLYSLGFYKFPCGIHVRER